MTDLHTRLTAAIDQAERDAREDHQRGRGGHWAQFALHGLAEDRDILRRHQPDRIPSNRPQDWDCEGCAVYMSNLACDYGAHEHTVHWPCPEVLSVARRHGIDPEVT